MNIFHSKRIRNTKVISNYYDAGECVRKKYKGC